MATPSVQGSTSSSVQRSITVAEEAERRLSKSRWLDGEVCAKAKG